MKVVLRAQTAKLVILATLLSIGIGACGDTAQLADEDSRVFRTLTVAHEAHFERMNFSLVGTTFLEDGPLRARWRSLWNPDDPVVIHMAFRVPYHEWGGSFQVGANCSFLVLLLTPVGRELQLAEEGSITVRPIDESKLRVSANVLLGEARSDAIPSTPWRLILTDLEMTESAETPDILRGNRYLAHTIEEMGWLKTVNDAEQ